MHVAVIGAGAAGLCVARHLAAANHRFSFVVYEQTGSIGGLWVYTEATGFDEYGLPVGTAMYKNLRTNIPTKTMEFPDFPFKSKKSFVTGPEVLQYLEDYSVHFDLKKHVKFFHHVKSVTPQEGKWQLVTVDLSNNTESVDEFDAVVVCNGHNSVPRMGDFQGLSDFQGLVQHSYSYRTPEPFAGKTVLVVGGGPSGTDISFDLATLASKVYFSHRGAKKGGYPENVEEVPEVKQVLSHSVVFEDDTTSGHIDVILVCTGYSYAFPFLTPGCGVYVTDGKYVQPLYKHIVNINNPTMGFIGIPFTTFIFPMLHQQALFFLKSLTGDFQLPDKETMLTELYEYLDKKIMCGVPLKFYHQIHDEVIPYIKQLETMAKLQPLPPVYYNIFYAIEILRNLCLENYRDADFEVVDSYDFNISGVEIDKEKLISHKYYITRDNLN